MRHLVRQRRDSNATEARHKRRKERKERKENILSADGGNQKSSTGNKKSQLPENWYLPKEWGDWATEKGMDEATARIQAEQFKDYHISNGSKKIDWKRTWQTWVRNYFEFQKPRTAQGGNQPQHGDTRFKADGTQQVYMDGVTGWVNEYA